MKSIFALLLTAFCIIFFSCNKIPTEKGFLSSDIKLKGSDTTYLPLGAKGYTDIAWLDGSSQPVTFSIADVRDAAGNKSEQFFAKYKYRTWTAPYNNLTDTTVALLNAKVSETDQTAFDINPITGMLYYLETTNNFKNPGDVFKVDVKISNSKGSEILKNYATLKLTTGAKDFDIQMLTTAIILVNNLGQTSFTLYDNITTSQPDRIQNVYDRNGKEFPDIYKAADTPSQGVKVLIKYIDADGKIFDSKDYATYSTGTESYFNYAVNRKNTSDGAWIEFPMTPWPVKNGGLLSYLKGGVYDFTTLDTAALHNEVYNLHKYPYNAAWPDRSWGASKWYIRLRSNITFYNHGTYVIACKFPYVHLH